MATSKPSTERKRLAALCEQAISELRSERRAARSPGEKKQLSAQIAAMRDMLGRAREPSGGKKGEAGR